MPETNVQAFPSTSQTSQVETDGKSPKPRSGKHLPRFGRPNPIQKTRKGKSDLSWPTTGNQYPSPLIPGPSLQILTQDPPTLGIQLSAVGDIKPDAVHVDQNGAGGAKAPDVVVVKQKFGRAAISNPFPLVRLLVPLHANDPLNPGQKVSLSQLLPDEIRNLKRQVGQIIEA